jgi:hypothetical protein
MNPYWVVIAFTLLTQLFVFLRWLHRHVRDSEIERAFLRDLAVYHLPHIYHVVELIAAHMKIPIEPPPPLRSFDFYGNDDRRQNQKPQ